MDFVEHKVCLYCGKTFVRKEGYPEHRWVKRRYCSKSCATRGCLSSKIDTYKTCMFCGKQMVKRENESPAAFNSKKFCSRSCVSSFTKNGAFKPKEQHWNWKGGKYIDKLGYVNMRINGRQTKEHTVIIEKEIGRCMNKNEVVHHVNGIRNDNRIENLRLMTNSEHTKLHKIGKLASEKTKKLLRCLRKGTNFKEKHNQWKRDITEEKINKALLVFDTQKEASKFLGIHPETLRRRIKYYNKGIKNGK